MPSAFRLPPFFPATPDLPLEDKETRQAMRSTRLTLALLFGLAAATGCGGSSDSGPSAVSPPPTQPTSPDPNAPTVTGLVQDVPQAGIVEQKSQLRRGYKIATGIQQAMHRQTNLLHPFTQVVVLNLGLQVKDA